MTTKKNKQSVYEFLLNNHDKENVFEFKAFNSREPWNWSRTLRTSKCSNESGILIFTDNKDNVLYIGQTTNIFNYCPTLKNMTNINPCKIYVVINVNPSYMIHAVTSYRALFKPIYMSTRNTRFMFDKNKKVYNLSKSDERAVNWIKQHPNSTYTQFMGIFSQTELSSLSRSFESKSLSYYELKKLIHKK